MTAKSMPNPELLSKPLHKRVSPQVFVQRVQTSKRRRFEVMSSSSVGNEKRKKDNSVGFTCSE
jgi:hypothetical protein